MVSLSTTSAASARQLAAAAAVAGGSEAPLAAASRRSRKSTDRRTSHALEDGRASGATHALQTASTAPRLPASPTSGVCRPRLRGRSRECEALDRLVDRVQGGQSQVLVTRGEAGVGKSALLDYVVDRASGCQVARAVGVESEMELAFAGLHQL